MKIYLMLMATLMMKKNIKDINWRNQKLIALEIMGALISKHHPYLFLEQYFLIFKLKQVP